MGERHRGVSARLVGSLERARGGVMGWTAKQLREAIDGAPDEALVMPVAHAAEGWQSSPEIGELATALAAAQADMDAAKRDSKNPHFNSTYADLRSVVDACFPALNKHGLAVLQPISQATAGPSVTVTTLLVHGASGQWVSSAMTYTSVREVKGEVIGTWPDGKEKYGPSVIEACDSPQAKVSATTYGRRNGLAAMVGVAPADDDGEAAMGRTVPTQATPRATVIKKDEAPVDTSHRVEGKLYIESVEQVSGDKRDGSGRWTKTNVTFSDGQQASTFNGPLATDCEHYRKSQSPVKIMTSPASNPKWNDTLDACEPDPVELTSSDITF